MRLMSKNLRVADVFLSPETVTRNFVGSKKIFELLLAVKHTLEVVVIFFKVLHY